MFLFLFLFLLVAPPRPGLNGRDVMLIRDCFFGGDGARRSLSLSLDDDEDEVVECCCCISVYCVGMASFFDTRRERESEFMLYFRAQEHVELYDPRKLLRQRKRVLQTAGSIGPM